MLEQVGAVPEVTDIPPQVDLQGWFSPVEDQGRIGSCTAHAVCGLAEYFTIRASGTYTNLSRLVHLQDDAEHPRVDRGHRGIHADCHGCPRPLRCPP
jgi:hypothetical protein